MKKLKSFLFTAILILISVSAGGCEEKERIIPASELPVEITNWISTHFPDNEIVRSKVEIKKNKKKYEIYLQGGFNLEFNSRKEITEIDGHTKLPDSVIPDKIKQYVDANYPDNFIISWELERNKQEVELDNGIELEFDLNGNFIRIDN